MSRSAATRTLLVAALITAGLTPVAVALPEKESEREREAERGFNPLEQAREESGVPAPPPQRFVLPGATLAITPSTLLAANPGQRIRFEVELVERVPGATLTVTLPRRWLERPASGLPAIAVPRRKGRAKLDRQGRTVELALADDATGASFEIEDLGIPAGSYRLPFSWRDASGRRTKAGTAKVTFYARVREGAEGEKENPWARLASPGIEANATGDGTEESETFIAVTPGDKDRIAVGANWSSPSMAAWISIDAGQTWTRRTLPQTIDAPGAVLDESGSICCDPMFAADALGNFWYGGLTLQNGLAPSRIIVNRIAAGGTTFQPTTTGLKTRTSGTQDKPMMTIDNSPTSPTYGRLYVVWDEPASGVNLVITQCDTRPGGVSNPANCDNADNWSNPVSVTPSQGSYIYPDVAVGPDGKVYVVWWDYSNTNAIRGDVCDPGTQNCASAAGWGTPQTIALVDKTGNVPLPFACPIRAQPGGRASTSPQVDVDRTGGATSGRVYVTWSDLRAGSGTTRCDDNLAPASTHLTFDSFVASAAGGALPGGALTSPNVGTRLITDGESGGAANSDDWFAWLAVDQTTGVAWADLYSTRNDTTRQTTNFYARSVTPSGGSHTLGPLTQVSTAASDYSNETCCQFGNDYGDYTGLDATEGIAYPVWTDNSTGDGEAFTFVGDVVAPPQAPVVTPADATAVGQTSATLNGSVNPNGQETSWHFEYGTTPGGPYPSSTADQSAGQGTSATTVSTTVSNLSPNTPHYFRLVANNASGTTLGAERTFTTDPQPPGPAAPSVTTGAATEITQTQAMLNATVNPNGAPTDFHFEYGTSQGGPYTASTASQSEPSGISDATVSAPVAGLTEGTDYYFRVVASNSEGPATGQEATFKTDPPAPPPPDTPPIVSTGAASLVDQRAATVSGTVNPNGQSTAWRFQYGTSTAYGSTTPPTSAGTGTSPRSVSARLSFLAAARVYHYRLTASNSDGITAGADRTFATGSVFTPPGGNPPDTTGPVMTISRRAVRLGGRRILRVRLRCASGEPENCAGTLRLYRTSGPRKLGQARFNVAPGRTKRVRVRLSRAGLRLLRRRGRLRVLARARARDSVGNLGTKGARFTLRPPRRG